MNRKEIACIAFSILAIESSLGMDPYGASTRQSDSSGMNMDLSEIKVENPYAPVTWTYDDKNFCSRNSEGKTVSYEMFRDPVVTPNAIVEYWKRPDGSIYVNKQILECGRNSTAEEKVMEAPINKMVPVYYRVGRWGSHWEYRGNEETDKKDVGAIWRDTRNGAHNEWTTASPNQIPWD